MDSFFLFNHFPDTQRPDFTWERHNHIFKSNNVIFWAKTRQADFPEHWGCLSIKTVIAGEEHFIIDNEKFTLTKEKYLILNDGQHYGSFIDAEEEVESFTVNFAPDFAKKAWGTLVNSNEELLEDYTENAASSLEFVQHFFGQDELITPLIQKIRALSKDFSQNHHQLQEYYFYLFKALLLKQAETIHAIRKISAVKHSTQKELYRRIARGRDYIDSNFAQAISLEDMAQAAYLSMFHFLESFKKIYGLTPYQYLTKVRLERAKMLLQGRKMSVQQVCQTVGYEDVSSFSKLYKKTFGVSPSKVEKAIGD